MKNIGPQTQVKNLASNLGRRPSQKRQKTQFIDHSQGWFSSPQQQNLAQDKKQRKKFVRFSGIVRGSKQNRINQKKQGDKFKNFLQWSKLGFTAFDKKKQDRIATQISEAQTVQSHLQQVMRKQRRPTQLHKRLLTQPCLPSNQRRKRRERSAEVPMDRLKYSRCCDTIDQIYSKIKVLKEIGYPDSKIDFWILLFCQGQKPFMKHVFMKNINFSVYSLQEEYSYERQSQKVKEKIRHKMRKGKDIFAYIQLEEIQAFCNYLEDILIRKNAKKARQIEESITDKLSQQMVFSVQNDYCIFTKDDPAEVYNFTVELDTYEEKFGTFQSFSKINKLRFTQLNRIEKSLKQNYKSLLHGEVQKIVRPVIQESQLQVLSQP